MSVDNVSNAAATPEHAQPYRDLGVKDDEYQRIRDILGRRPTSSELAMYSVMWSEHCSYKSSKVHLKQFGDKKPQTDALLVGIGENAGVVDIGNDWAVTLLVGTETASDCRTLAARSSLIRRISAIRS